MANYHVGCGLAGIYAGTLNKKGNMWITQSDVTDEAINAVAQFLLEHEESMKFSYRGKRYRLAVTQIESESQESENKSRDLEQEPKTGHWIERRNRATGHIESVCSECGAEEGYPYNDYCGNCGAKMEEGE